MSIKITQEEIKELKKMEEEEEANKVLEGTLKILRKWKQEFEIKKGNK
jgi:hypothetical protein